jgi:hypothetical protein
MRIVYEGGSEGLQALARELDDEGVRFAVALTTDRHRALLHVEIEVYGDDETGHLSEPLKEAVRWVVANFDDGRPSVTASLVDD